MDQQQNQPYDSTNDAMRHKLRVYKLMNKFIDKLYNRSIRHDQSKLSSPEKECFDKYIPMLKEVKYGSKEYLEIRDKMMDEGQRHHFENNSHHPEHYENGIDGMNLYDIIEMYCDWKAASANSDTPFEDGLKMNAKRFHMSDQLLNIFKNTSK